MHDTSAKVRSLNDCFRRSLIFRPDRPDAGVSALETDAKVSLLRLAQTFDAFTRDNEPHGEHNFVAINLAGRVARCN